MATKKTPAKKTPAKAQARENAAPVPKSMPKAGRDPKGGLTAEGREYFNKKEGSHLRPGVQGPADTPEKMVRKGSFLRRHFAHPRGPMHDEAGEPTRLALSAHAWGEPVPATAADARKLAAKGHDLLEQYHEVKDADEGERKVAKSKVTGSKVAKSKPDSKATASKAAGKKAVSKKTSSKKVASRRT